MENMTIYSSEFMTINNNQTYTKHYFIEGQRVASKLGNGFETPNVNLSQSQVDNPYPFYERAMAKISRDAECVGDNLGDVSYLNIPRAIDFHQNHGYNYPETEYHFYHTDHLGSSSLLTDPSGAITEHLQYLPFGEEFIYQKSNSASITAVHTFSGKEFDQESGYSYFGARYYEANLSIWLSVDPLSDKYPSHSPYNYCMNNPVMLVDPSGLCPENIEDATNNPGDPPFTGQVSVGVRFNLNNDDKAKVNPFVNLKIESELYENQNTKGTFVGGLEISLTDVKLNVGGQVKNSSDDGLFGGKVDFAGSYDIPTGKFGFEGKGYLEIKLKFGLGGYVCVEDKVKGIYLNSATSQVGWKYDVKKKNSAFVQSKLSTMPDLSFPSFAAGQTITLGGSFNFNMNMLSFLSNQEAGAVNKFKSFPLFKP